MCFRLFMVLMIAVSWGVSAQEESQSQSASDARTPPHERVPAAGTDEHLWMLFPSATGYELLHHATLMKGPGARTAISLPDAPAHFAAAGNRLWLVYEPTAIRAGEARIRPVYTVRAVANPATGLFFNDPPRRLELADALPGAGRLVGVVGTSRGLMALLAPASWRAAGVEASENSIAAEDGLDEPRLLELGHTGWMDVESPEELKGLEPLALAADDRDQPIILATDPHPRQRAVYVFRRLSSGEWVRHSLALSRDFLGTALVQNQLYLLMHDGASRLMSVALLRDEKVYPVAEVEVRGRFWGVAPLGTSIALIERNVSADDRPTLRLIDPIQGTVGDSVEFQPQQVEGTTRLYMPFVLGLIMTVILLIFVLRPMPTEPEAELAPGLVPLDLTRRMVALFLDALPGVFVAAMVLGTPLEEMWHLIWWSMTLVETESVALCAGTTVLHGAVSEMIWGRSFGKWIVGARVVTTDGEKPRSSAVVIRQILKFVTMVIPALGVFVLVNNTRQGMGELMSKTIVIWSRRPGEDAGAPSEPS